MPHKLKKSAAMPAIVGLLGLTTLGGFGTAPVRADSAPTPPPPAEPPAVVSGASEPAEPPASVAGTSVVAPIAAAASANIGATASAADPATEDRLKALEERIRQLTDELTKIKENQKPEAVGIIVDEELKNQKPVAGFSQGFFIQSPDGANQFRLRGHLQTYFRGATNPKGRTNPDSIFLRRARPVFEATLQKYVEFRIMPDFGQGGVALFDAYLQLNHLPSAQIRVGKFKEPLSLERWQGAPDLHFVERSITNNLGPNRDVGIQIGGPILNHRAEYEIGLFNGSQDLGNVDGDPGNDKDVVARLFLTPFANSQKSPLKELGFGIAASNGSRDEAAGGANYRTAGRASFFRFTPGTTGDGTYTRFAPQMYYFYGPFGLMSEYMSSRQELINGAKKGAVNNKGWFAHASWVLTGEHAGFRNLTPKHPFDRKKGHWGAFEIAARYSLVNLDDTAFARGFADPAVSASSATAWTVGLNWYLNRNLKVQLNYERTNFDHPLTFGGLTTDHEDVFLANFQVAF